MTAKDEIDLIIASKSDWRGATLAKLRSIILDASDEINENVKWKMPSKPLGSPTWETNGIICVADYLKSAVRLTFPKGANLPDPDSLFNARMDSKVARAIDYFETSNIDASALARLIEAAQKENQL